MVSASMTWLRGSEDHAAATQAKPIHVALAAGGRLAVHTDSRGTLNTDGFEYLLRVVDPETLADIGPPLGGVKGVDGLTRLSMSDDGTLIGAVTDLEIEGGIAHPAEALIWDVESGTSPVLRYAFDGESGRDMVLMPNSKSMLVAGDDGTTVVDIATGQEIRRIVGSRSRRSR